MKIDRRFHVTAWPLDRDADEPLDDMMVEAGDHQGALDAFLAEHPYPGPFRSVVGGFSQALGLRINDWTAYGAACKIVVHEERTHRGGGAAEGGPAEGPVRR